MTIDLPIIHWHNCDAAERSRLLARPVFNDEVSAAGDQQRIVTPERAIRSGADYLVVGRPIRDAADPHAAHISPCRRRLRKPQTA